jgi:hypothetical protein
MFVQLEKWEEHLINMIFLVKNFTLKKDPKKRYLCLNVIIS